MGAHDDELIDGQGIRGKDRIPLWLAAVYVAVTAWAGWYLVHYLGGIAAPLP